MKYNSLLLAGAALLGAASSASASGFQVNLQGQKNIGMGGVGVGLSLDQAAMFYNPGALAMVRKNGVQVGCNFALARNAYRAENGTGQQRELENAVVTPANFYASFGPKEGKWKIGIGAYTPFGSELHYADNWEGRYVLTDINLRSIFAQLTASYAITDKISIGAGVVMLAYGDVNLQRDVPLQESPSAANPTPRTPHVTLDGKAEQKVGYNVGIYAKPSAKFSVGASYRSKIDAQVKGGTVGVSDVIGSTKANFTATNFDVTLPLPSTASIGFGFMPNERFIIGLDANYVMWNDYKSLDFTFSGNNGYGDRTVVTNGQSTVVAGTPGLLGGSNVSNSKREYKNSVATRLGVQYMATKGLALRLGGFYDISAVKDGYVTPETPDADRIGLTAGLTYTFNDTFGVDLSFLYEDFMKRSQSQSELVANGTAADRVAGTYKTTIAVPGVGLFVKF